MAGRRPRTPRRASLRSDAKSGNKSPGGTATARPKQPPKRAPSAAANKVEPAKFPVVGIGASAGGVEALGRFFDAMPADSGAAFVVVLHLDPTRESQMAHLLSGRTEMPVAEIEDGMRIEPDHVYVIAPDASLTVRDGRLRLSEPTEPRGHRKPVDVLFSSLAADRRERAVAIVLSGTGTNGTEGLKDVRAEGGLILVQDPHTAKFDGMPRSAIAADMADHVLAPEKMPERLIGYLRHDYIAAPEGVGAAAADGQAMFDRVLELLRGGGRHDFRSYKASTLRRRINRRLSLRNIGTLGAYVEELRANPEEAAALVKDLMISVTSFFRDTEAWNALSAQAIAPMIADKQAGSALRVWAPACATGEEAYSVAMLAIEQAEAAGKQLDVKIFATDAQDDNLRRARDGVYPQAAVAGLPPERLRRFFDKLDGSYRVKKELRDALVLAPQNLLRDPPFSHLDLISCRNLLIYLETEAQRRVIALCHFALREGGYLFLGNAETVGQRDDLFETVSKKWRIYRRLGPTRHDIVDFPLPRGPVQPRKAPGAEEHSPLPAERNAPAAEVARRALLERYAPASVLVDRKCRILYFHGATGDYLEQPTGEPTRNLLAMVRDGLAAKLRAAIREAIAGNRGVTVDTRIGRSATGRPVAMTVTPLTGSQGEDSLLVSFEPAPGAPDASNSAVRGTAEEAETGEHGLREELDAARRELRRTTEHMETANEELKAANEEATSMNEELQSTNEELETSKEELQSFNEELHTVNSQLQHKVRELEDTTNDLNNLLAGTDTATLFLDTDFRIKWFAPAMKELFDFVASDIGRPMGHFARKFADENLLADAETVLKRLTTVEAEVQSDSGHWYLRRMLPYRTLDNHIAGAVVTFTDITGRKRDADAINEARLYAEAIVETIRQPLLVLGGDLRVVSANSAFYELFQTVSEETEGRALYNLAGHEWDIPRLRTLLGEVLSKDRQVNDFEIEHKFSRIGQRCLLLNARRLERNGGREELILLAIEDITDRRHSEQAVRESEAQYRTLFNSIDEGFCVIEKVETAPGKPIDFRYAVANPAFERQTGVGGVVGKTIREAFPGEPQEWFDTYDALLRDGEPIRFERGLITKGRVLELYAFRLDDSTQRRVAVIFQDITGRKGAEELGHRLAAIVESSDDAIVSKDLNGIITTWNKGAEELFGYTAEEIIGKPVATLIPSDRPDEEPGILERIRRGETIDHYETIRQRKDGSRVWVSLTVSPLRDAQGKVVGASKIARDMTERRSAEEHREILIGELNHRVKNTLATVQAVASQTLGGAASLEEARHAFGSRLMALARAHDLLTEGDWEGADLGNVVRRTFEPHAAGGSRFHIEGPRVALAPGAALSLTMALHELCTNAAKYGALSTKKGHVDVIWRVTGNGGDRRLHVRWAESGGPSVTPPARKGFGSRLIERALAQELGGEVRVSYEPPGLVCSIEAPLSAVQTEAHLSGDERKSES